MSLLFAENPCVPMTIELTRAFSEAKLQIFSDTAKFSECNFLYFT